MKVKILKYCAIFVGISMLLCGCSFNDRKLTIEITLDTESEESVPESTEAYYDEEIGAWRYDFHHGTVDEYGNITWID